MSRHEEIANVPKTVMGLCSMARRLGYKDRLYRLQNADGTSVGDFVEFLEGNPGCIEAIVSWALLNHPEAQDGRDEDPSEMDRDDCENDVSHELTLGKADADDIVFHIKKATGISVPVDQDDPLRELDLEDLRKLVRYLRAQR